MQTKHTGSPLRKPETIAPPRRPRLSLKRRTWIVLGAALLGTGLAVVTNRVLLRSDKADRPDPSLSYDPALQKVQVVAFALQKEYDARAPKPSSDTLAKLKELADLGPKGREVALSLYEAWLRRMFDANQMTSQEFRELFRGFSTIDSGAPKRLSQALLSAQQPTDRAYFGYMLSSLDTTALDALWEGCVDEARAAGGDMRLEGQSAFPSLLARLDVKALKTVTAGLRHEEPAVRRQSLRSIALMAPEYAMEAVPSVLESLQDKDPSVRALAALVIGELTLQPDRPANPALERALDDPDPLVRLVAARTLSRHGSYAPARVSAVVVALLTKNQLSGRIDDGPDQKPVLWWQIPSAATDFGDLAIWKGGGGTTSYTAQFWDEVAAHVLLDLGSRHRLQPESIVAMLKTCPHDGRHLGTLLAAQGQAASAAVPELASMVNHAEFPHRRKALTVLGKLSSQVADDAVPAIVAALDHPDGRTRWHAFLSLVQIDPEAAKKHLPAKLHAAVDRASAGMLRRELAGVTRWTRNIWQGSAAILLPVAGTDEAPDANGLFRTPTDLDVVAENRGISGMLDQLQLTERNNKGDGWLGKDSVPFLVAIWQGSARNPVTRARFANKALELLAREGPAAEAAVPHLVTAMSYYSKDPASADLIPKTLVKIGEPAVPHLTAVLNDPAQSAWHLPILDSLKDFGPKAEAALPSLIKILETSDEDRRSRAVQVFGVLGSAGNKAVPELRKLLKSEKPDVQRHAANALGLMGLTAKPALPDLIGLFGGDNEQLRVVAIRAVAGVGKDAVEPLTVSLKDPRDKVRLSAVRAFAPLQDTAKPALPALQQLANSDPSETIRLEAAQVANSMEKK